jgi:hypothetical protein
LFLSGRLDLGKSLAHSAPGCRCALQFLAAQLSEPELLAARAGLVVLPCVLDKTVIFESLQERVQRPAFDAREAVLPKDFGDGVAVTFAVAEHRKHCLGKRCAGQLLVEVISLTHR